MKHYFFETYANTGIFPKYFCIYLQIWLMAFYQASQFYCSLTIKTAFNQIFKKRIMLRSKINHM